MKKLICFLPTWNKKPWYIVHTSREYSLQIIGSTYIPLHLYLPPRRGTANHHHPAPPGKYNNTHTYCTYAYVGSARSAGCSSSILWWHTIIYFEYDLLQQRGQGGGAFWRSGFQRLGLHNSQVLLRRRLGAQKKMAKWVWRPERQWNCPRNWSCCRSSSWSTSVARWDLRYSRQRSKIFVSEFWSAEFRTSVGRSVSHPAVWGRLSAVAHHQRGVVQGYSKYNNIVQATDLADRSDNLQKPTRRTSIKTHQQSPVQGM